MGWFSTMDSGMGWDGVPGWGTEMALLGAVTGSEPRTAAAMGNGIVKWDGGLGWDGMGWDGVPGWGASEREPKWDV